MRLRSVQKQAVLEAVRSSHSHPSAEEIYAQVKKKMPKISLGTVYRNLHILTQEGAIQEVLAKKGPVRYDGHLHPHAHFTCDCCDKLLDLNWVLKKKFLSDLEKQMGIHILDYELFFHGICPHCKKKSKHGSRKTFR